MYKVQAFQVQEKVRTMEAEQVPAYIDGLKQSGTFQNLPDATQKWLEARRSGTLPSLDKGEAGVGAIAKIPNYKGEATRAINERILALHDDKQNQNIDQKALELTQSSVLMQASEEYDNLLANYPDASNADKVKLMSKAMQIAAEKVLPDKNSLSGAGTALEPLRDNLSKREIEGVSISTTRLQTKEHLRDSLVVPDTKLKVMMQANPDLLNSTTKGIEAIINISRKPNGVLDENTVIASLDSDHAREIFKQEQNKNRFATYGDTLLRLAKAAGASTEALGIIKENSTTPQEAEWAYNQGITARHNEYPTDEGSYLTKGGEYTLAPHALSTSFPVTGTFGESRGYGREHAGLDLGTPQGTPILAKTGGVVIDAGFTGTGAGGEIFIDNGNGYDSRHLHMNGIAVQPGQRIEPGQLLGYSGGAVGTKGAGHSTGPHLHTEIRLNGQLLNPKQYIDQFFGYGVKK